MLTGKTVLIVEEEFLIALDIQRMLETLNARETIFARSAREALEMQERWPSLALGLIEIRHGRPETLELAQQLSAAGVPLIVTTADVTLRRGVPELPGIAVIVKPVPETELASAIAGALAN